ncbi:MAG: hypothetical protein WDO74_25990 [Pseudomonadota bacterium]
MMKDCVNAMSWMSGMCGKSMRALVVARPVAADRDIADRLKRFVGQRVLLARDRVELWVAAEPSFERAVEIGAPDTR